MTFEILFGSWGERTMLPLFKEKVNYVKCQYVCRGDIQIQVPVEEEDVSWGYRCEPPHVGAVT